MHFVLKGLFKDNVGDRHYSHPVGIITADSPEEAAKKAGRTIKGTGGGPDGHLYCELTIPSDEDIFPVPLVMSFLPEVDSPEDLVKIRVLMENMGRIPD